MSHRVTCRKQNAAPCAEPLESRTLLSASATFGSTTSTNVAGLVTGIGDLQSADFNADGKQDLVAGVNTSGKSTKLTGTEILLSNGDGSFTAVAGPAFPSSASSESTGAFAVFPLNGNARTSLLYASQNANGKGVLTVETDTGIGSSAAFQMGAATTIPTALDLNPQQVLTINLHNTTANDAADTGQLDVAVLGLNGDGGEDLVILSGNGDGTFTLIHDFTLLNLTDGQLIAGSFYGSSATDLAVFDPSHGKLYTFESSINSAPGSSNLSFTEGSAQLSLDLPGYAAASVAVTTDTTDRLVVAEDPTGTSGSSQIVPFDLAPGAATPEAVAGAAAAFGAPSGDTAGAIATGDFDGTGDPDVISAYGINIGDGTLYAGPTPALNSASGKSGYSEILGTDLNADGKLDAVAADAATGQIRAAMNNTAKDPSLIQTSVRVSSARSSYPSGGELVSGFVQNNTAGEVQVFSGTSLLDTTTLNGQQNIDRFRFQSSAAPANLSMKFLGNNIYAPSSTTPTPTGTATLTPTFGALRLPKKPVFPGARVHLMIPVVVTNTGTAASSGRANITVFLSTTSNESGGEYASVQPNLILQPRQSRTFHLTIGSLYPATQVGAYYVVAQTYDSNGNTLLVTFTSTLTVAEPFIDLTGSLHPLPASLSSGKSTPVTLTVTNNGNDTATGLLQVAFFARAAGTTGASDDSLGTPGIRVDVPASASRLIRLRVTLPTTLTSGGSYSLIATLDPNNMFNDNNLSNNTLTGPAFTVK